MNETPAWKCCSGVKNHCSEHCSAVPKQVSQLTFDMGKTKLKIKQLPIDQDSHSLFCQAAPQSVSPTVSWYLGLFLPQGRALHFPCGTAGGCCQPVSLAHLCPSGWQHHLWCTVCFSHLGVIYKLAEGTPHPSRPLMKLLHRTGPTTGPGYTGIIGLPLGFVPMTTALWTSCSASF